MGESITLKDIVLTLKKRLLLICTVTIAATLLSGVVSYFFLTPVYQASTQILVNQTKNDQTVLSTSDVQTNLQLINTYNVIIKSPAILDKVTEELNLGLTVKELNNKISVASEKNSQVVNITVQYKDPHEAALITNKTAEVFKKEIIGIMNVDNVKILAKASPENILSPIKPKPLINIALAFVVGLLASIGLTFLLEYLDNTVKNEQDIEKLLGLPVLGVIGTISNANVNQNLRMSNKAKRVRGESFGS